MHDTSTTPAVEEQAASAFAAETGAMHEHSMHTHTAGELRREDIGREVTLTGWVWRRRDHGGLIFVDLRDRSGMTKCTFDPEHSGGTAFHAAETIRPEWPICVHGVVRGRDEETINPKLPTGEIEVRVDTIEILNRSKTPPFQIEDGIDTAEDTRLRYRYLDIRRPEMMANLKLRSDLTFAIREALHNRAFMEVETPSLFKSTPEGARDFLVPCRIQPGRLYALPQSPQLLKQLLMVGGVERYYQVAKCFRDEDLRADRQPEFTQVDIEMSFVDQNDVMSALEDVLHDAFAKMGVDMPTPLRRMDYWDAMDTYGIDKPDTRYGMHLVDVTDIFTESKFKVFSSAANTEGSVVKCINAKGAGNWSRGDVEKLADVAAANGAKGMAWIAYTDTDTELAGKSPLAARAAHHMADYLMRGIDGAVGPDPERALGLYVQAEAGYYHLIDAGLTYYQRQLDQSIEGQQLAREALQKRHLDIRAGE